MAEWVAASGGESESGWRQFLSYLFAQDSLGMVTPGVLDGPGGSELLVSQTATASGSVNVTHGVALTQDSRINGVKPVVNNSNPKTLDIFTGNPMGGLPRNDLVIADSATGTIRALIGSPNAVPTDPTVPATAVPLARLRHAASATTIPASKIDDLRTVTTLSTSAAPSWQPYGIAITTSGLALTIVNGTLTGRYMDLGKTRFVHVEYVRGSSDNAGNADYLINLPPGTYKSYRVSGSGHYLDASPFKEIPFTVRGIGGGMVALVTSTGARIAYNNPAVAVGDELVFDLVIELA